LALVRLKPGDEVWDLLRYSPDPRLRSFIVNWLHPLGADPRTIADQLDRISATAKPTPAPGQSFMDAVLFHPGTAQRRALILALGTFGTEDLPPGEPERLIAKLLPLYRDDPDAGIHGAAEWTLRRWKKEKELGKIDAELRRTAKGDRRWYVNAQGLTFVIVEGPVEFGTGSPPNEPDRFAPEVHQLRTIPRRFAIATKEVSIKQYQEFLNANPDPGIARVPEDM
jgi:hypothetical protein